MLSLPLEQGELPQRVAVHHDQVGQGTRGHDAQLIAKVDLKMTLDKSVTEAQMNKVVAFYAKTKPGGIRGLRPKTHKAFIDSLSEADRKKLAKEATAYVNKNDFKKK